MKQLVKNYTFSASGKTVTLTDFSTVLLERLQLIVDTTTNTILYNFADASVATATVATNIITLSTVGSASSSDKLQVIYDAATSDPTYDTPVLPANAAKETGGNLAAIKADTDKIPSQGQALAAASMPVVLTAAQVTTLTPPAAITNYANETGGNLATIATDVAPLVASGAGGYVRQDSTATIAKESGGNLAAIKTDLDTIAGTVSGGKVLTTETNSSTIATNTAASATSANQTNGNQQTKITNGTNIADVVAGDSGFNGVVTASISKSFTFTTSGTGAQTIFGPTSCEGYSWVTVHITANSTSGLVGLNGQFSSTSGGTFSTVQNFTQPSLINSTISGLGGSNGGYYQCAITDNFFQVVITALTSGTLSGTITFSNKSSANQVGLVQQSGSWMIGSSSATGSAVPANAFYVGLKSASGSLSGLSSADNTGDGGGASSVASAQIAYNGTAVNTWDRVRMNSTVAVIAAGTTTTQTNIALTTYNAKKLVIVVNISAFTSGSLTVAINGKSTSGYSYPILTSSALVAVAVTPLRIFAGSTPSSNAVANDVVPRDITITATVSGTLTFGIDAILAV